MAETEERKYQDIGQDEAYVVNLKETVAAEKDIAGRNRVFFDALMSQTVALNANMTATLASINHSIALSAQKQAENVTGVNMTDVMEKMIAGSPYEDFAKAVASAVLAAMNKTS